MVKFGTQITAKNLCKSFGSTSVLKGIDLAVSSGEFVAVVGRSGCGKSTLLRVIAGLDHPTEGSVYADVFKVDGIQSDIRIMFQDSRLLPWKRVLDNVQLGLKGERQNDARDALRLVGLEDRYNDWPGVLSGGQKQRVALARALASHPRLLLLDEPLGALDALTRIEMQELIEYIWRQQKFTAFLVTHDVSEAIALADRVILIEDGKISLDIGIPLSRPRERNGDFIYFEKLILDRLMQRTESISAQEQTG